MKHVKASRSSAVRVTRRLWMLDYKPDVTQPEENTGGLSMGYGVITWFLVSQHRLMYVDQTCKLEDEGEG